MRIQFSPRSWLASLAMLTFLAPAAWAQPPMRFDLPAQPLAETLRALGSQTNINILFDPPLVKGRKAPALNEALTVDEALSRVLAGSGITHQFLNESTVVLGSASAPRTRADAGGDSFRLAQVSTAASATPPPAEAVTKEESELVVTGSHIRGVKDLAAPSIVITRGEIEQTGFSTVQDLFESLPQNFAEVSSDGLFGRGGSSLATFNRDRAAGIDLRGLGASSTLTLLNGTRRAGSINGQVVDVSIIPLSVIERVDIVTGGRSAAYGSDAVAGVVNLVTRREFTGIESQVYFGGSDRGGERLQFSTITGGNFSRGGIVAAYDYARDWTLDLLDTPLVSSPRPTGAIPLRVDLQPESERHSLFLSGKFSVSDRMELFADALYSTRDLQARTRDLYPGATIESFSLADNESKHYSIATGANVDIASGWALALNAGYSVADNYYTGASLFVLGATAPPPSIDLSDTVTSHTSFSAVVDGPLFSVGAVTPRLALGAETRTEDMERTNLINGFPIARFGVDRDRTVNSAFAELSIPLLGEGTNSLEVSLAGRYDDYSDFGGTFNPQVGVIWAPTETLKLRGAYSTAFRTAALPDLGTLARVVINEVTDPLAADGSTFILQWEGPNSGLTPEEAKTWSVGFDYEPSFAPWARASVSYFNVKYQDRIDVPAVSFTDQFLVLEREPLFVGLIDRSPTQALAEAILASDADGIITNFTEEDFDPETDDIMATFPGLVVFDNRSNNIAVETVKGLDLKIDTRFEAGGNTFDLGVNGTFTLQHERSLTSTSPVFSLLNEPGKPVDMRLRANAGMSRSAFGAYVYVNYVDGYMDPVAPALPVNSWTTVGLTLRFDNSRADQPGPLGRFSAALSIDNLLDEDPPRLRSSSSGLLFDPSNASIVGRFVSLRLTKNW